MARTSAFFGSVKPKAFCQKRLKLSFGFAELAYRLGSGALFLWFVSFWTNKKKWTYKKRRCKPWSVCRNSLHKKDCFAFGSAIPGEILSNKKPLSQLIFVISTSLLNASIGRSVEITKRPFSRPFCLSGKRDSNPRPSAWEADALPLSYSRII